MEQNIQNLMEMIDRPAFTVCDGIISQCNQMAKNRLIQVGSPVSELMPEACSAYNSYSGGILYLTLQIGWIPCGATVIRQDGQDIFLLDRDSDQAQLQALSLAAQQLRVPLSNVMTLADLMFPELKEKAQIEQAAQMRHALFQLMRQISNMADAERYTGLNTPNYETTELGSFMQEIFEKANTTLQDTKVCVRFSCPTAPIFTIADRECLGRAVYNLISNAVKFSKPESYVTGKLTVNGNLACLTVEDQGDGVAAHVQGSLFHRYIREPAIEDSRFGLGLGMTLVRSAAAMHGGTVLLEQTEGTRVAMTIAIRKQVSGTLRSPKLRIGDYTGGRDQGLLEFSESLPTQSYQQES